LWLRAQGIDVETIGIVLAAPMVVRLLSVPLTSRLVDQWGSLHGGLVAASIGTAFGYTMVALVDGFPAVLAAVALASIPFTLTGPLAEAYALKGLAARDLRYGSVVAANLAAGSLTLYIRPTDLVWAMVEQQLKNISRRRPPASAADRLRQRMVGAVREGPAHLCFCSLRSRRCLPAGANFWAVRATPIWSWLSSQLFALRRHSSASMRLSSLSDIGHHVPKSLPI
jgi:PPP family 3-phenylpropionic acid transporter